MNSMRHPIGRLTLAITTAVALAACTLSVPEESEEVAQRDEAFTRAKATGPAPVATMTPPAVAPNWIGTCSQVQPTYIVRRASGSCDTIETAGGSWLGCDLEPGVENGFCIYRWSSGTPSVSAYLALEAVAERLSNGRARVVADCSGHKAMCAAQPLAGVMDAECSNEVECCVMKPGCVWDEDMGDCKCFQDTQPACGVCGFVLDGDLRAVLDSASSNPVRYTVTSGEWVWTINPPVGAQTFVVPLPGAPDSTSVQIRRTP